MLCLNAQKDYKFILVLLDDRELKSNYKGGQKCGQILLDTAKILGLEEKDYFSFRFTDSNKSPQWIDLNKTIQSQFKCHPAESNSEITLHLSVKFYITDPCKLNHEITRYLYYLQLKRDILLDRIPVQFDYCVDLFSYFLQSELGDYSSKRDLYGYASEFTFIPLQSHDVEKAAEAKHQKLRGMSQASAEMNFLNKAKWLDFYGVDLYGVVGEDKCEYFIGLTPTGISVYQNKIKVSGYFWPRINKFNYKSCKFMLNVIDKQSTTTTHIFLLSSKQACKSLWKLCVDHHRFFRIKTVYEKPAQVKTTRAASKSRSSQEANRHEAEFRRIPAKRIHRKKVLAGQIEPEYLTGLLENSAASATERSNYDDSIKKANLENGNLIFNSSKTPQKNAEAFDDRSPTTSAKSSRSQRSYKFSNPARSDLFSENNENNPNRGQQQQRRRSSHRRLSTSRQATNNSNETDSNETDNNPSGTVHRRLSNSSRTSKRRHHHHHRSTSRDGQHSSQSRSRKKSLTGREQTSSVALIPLTRQKNEHETSLDDENNNDDSADISSQHKRQIRRRRRSKSPGGTNSKVPDEILQHIKYDLVEADVGMSADQLREIPFVKIETQAAPFRISPHQKRYKSKSPSRRKSGGTNNNNKNNKAAEGQNFYDSKTSIAYMVRDGQAHIAKTNKLMGVGVGVGVGAGQGDLFVTANVNDKKNLISSGSAVNSKLSNHFGVMAAEPGVNNVGFSADSGCEDMPARPS
jgi:hypothetical protein